MTKFLDEAGLAQVLTALKQKISSITCTNCTLASTSWSSSSQTVNVPGVTATNDVIVIPKSSDYLDSGITCTSQGSGTLTFVCTSTPSTNLEVDILIINSSDVVENANGVNF